VSILSRIYKWYDANVIHPFVGQQVDDEPIRQALLPSCWAQGSTPFGHGLLNPVEMALNERELNARQKEIRQLKFLLSMAPMMNAPSKADAWMWFKRVTTPYGYIHPKTLEQYSDLPRFAEESIHGVVTIPQSPTKWVRTSLMPEGTVLLTQTLGVEVER
jgi:hypothetical protein